MSDKLTFDDWCFQAVDERVKIEGRPVPLLSTLMYRLCDCDVKKFDEAMHIIERAFIAGQTGEAN